MANGADVQLAAFDLDGTLLNSNLQISPENVARLRALSDRGVGLALASGRTRMSIKPYIEQLDRPVAVIACNGARICLPGARGVPLGDICAERSLPTDVLGELVEFCRHEQLMHNIYVGDEILGPRESVQDPMKYYRDLYAERTKVLHRLVDTREYERAESAKFLICCAPARRDRLFLHLRPQFAHRCDMVKTNPEYLEFLTMGVHKGWGLQALCSGLQIDPARVLAVGDGDNDIELLRAAGRGVCLANGSKDCRTAAGYITHADHDGSGIAEALAWAGLA